MNGLDTNVLVRYVVADDEAQAAQAAKIIEGATSRKRPLFLSLLVLCEFVWVLDRSYRQPRAVIAATLEAVLDAEAFTVQRAEVARESLHRFRNGPADFADYVIGALARGAGCEAVYTFDRQLTGTAEFAVLAEAKKR